MVLKKQLVIRIVFFAELCLFMYGYGWGKHGILRLYEKKKANTILSQKLAQERTELEVITNHVIAWNEDFFYKERYAREQLHMAKKEEIIYLSS